MKLIFAGTPDFAAEALAAVDRTERLTDWQTVLLLGLPAAIAGLLITLIFGLFRRRKYILPGERGYNGHYTGLGVLDAEDESETPDGES